MASLGRPNAAYAGDRGDADPQLRAMLAAAVDHEGYLRAVAALCTARFLLPVMALGDDGGDAPDPDRHAELGAAVLRLPDGRSAIPAFTGLDALGSWRPGARPVPCRLDELASSALEQGAVAVLVDLAGPHPLVIEGDLLAELGRGRRLVELPDGGWGWLFAEPGDDSAPAGRTG
ncbi:MAG: SseB family protein [Propionicimonas sp.]|uniref:SseB family protein n=1 Tax=Propionicimonas sp. TaxID=1955623 RepID=UPI003D09B884